MFFTYRKFLRSSLIFNMFCSKIRTLFLCWITFYFGISCVITSILIYSVVTHYFFIRKKFVFILLPIFYSVLSSTSQSVYFYYFYHALLYYFCLVEKLIRFKTCK